MFGPPSAPPAQRRQYHPYLRSDDPTDRRLPQDSFPAPGSPYTSSGHLRHPIPIIPMRQPTSAYRGATPLRMSPPFHHESVASFGGTPPTSQPVTAAVLMAREMENRKPKGERILKEISNGHEKVESVIKTCTLLEEGQRNLRDQLHDVRKGLQAVPSKDELLEEMTAQLPTMMEPLLAPIMDRLASIIPPTAEEIASITCDKLKQDLRSDMKDMKEWMQDLKKEGAGREDRRSPVEEPLLSLMNHLITKLDPLQSLNEKLTSMQGLGAAIRDVAAFKHALNGIQNIVSDGRPSVSGGTPNNPVLCTPPPPNDSDSSRSLDADTRIDQILTGVDSLKRAVDEHNSRTNGQTDQSTLHQVQQDVSDIRFSVDALKTSLVAIDAPRQVRPLPQMEAIEDSLSELRVKIDAMQKRLDELPDLIGKSCPQPGDTPPQANQIQTPVSAPLLRRPATRSASNSSQRNDSKQARPRPPGPSGAPVPSDKQDVFGPVTDTSVMLRQQPAQLGSRAKAASSTEHNTGTRRARTIVTALEPRTSSVQVNARAKTAAQSLSQVSQAPTGRATMVPSLQQTPLPDNQSSESFFDGPCARTRSVTNSKKRKRTANGAPKSSEVIEIGDTSSDSQRSPTFKLTDQIRPSDTGPRETVDPLVISSSSSSHAGTPSDWSEDARAKRKELARKANIGRRPSTAILRRPRDKGKARASSDRHSSSDNPRQSQADTSTHPPDPTSSGLVCSQVAGLESFGPSGGTIIPATQTQVTPGRSPRRLETTHVNGATQFPAPTLQSQDYATAESFPEPPLQNSAGGQHPEWNETRGSVRDTSWRNGLPGSVSKVYGSARRSRTSGRRDLLADDSGEESWGL